MKGVLFIMQKLGYFNVSDAFNMELEPPLELVEGILRGKNKVSLLSGGSKTGKSTLAIDLAYCISKGLPFLKKKTTKKDVLYISLDNDFDLIIERLKLMGLSDNTHLDFYCDGPIYLGNTQEQVENIEILTLSEVINSSYNRLPNLGLVIIDVLQDIRSVDSKNEYSNTLIADDIKFLQGLAELFSVHILLLNHDTKRGSNDKYNSSMGGVKLVGTINGSYLHLVRTGMSSELAKLEIGGRNVKEQVMLLKHVKEKTKYELFEEDAIDIDRLDPDIAKIRNLVLKTDKITCSLGYLCAYLELGISTNALSRKLKRNKQLLLEENIDIEQKKSHKDGRLYTFTNLNPPKIEKSEEEKNNK